MIIHDCNECAMNPIHPERKCCFNCARSEEKCDVWHICGKDCFGWVPANRPEWQNRMLQTFGGDSNV